MALDPPYVACMKCGHEAVLHALNKHAPFGRDECVPQLVNSDNPKCSDGCMEFHPTDGGGTASGLLLSRPPSPEMLAAIRNEEERIATYGHVGQIITTEFKGQRVVAVGNTLFFSSKWKTFIDFLIQYAANVLGSDWGRSEEVKPLEERHPIVQWYGGTHRFLKEAARGSEEVCGAIPDGMTQAFIALAYDLYVLRHHRLLQESLLHRLKLKDQFQGARYELFVVATCIRARYRVDYSDETDTSTKHCEFDAIHEPTGQMITVEAKSRHRHGILGYSSETGGRGRVRLGIGRLLHDALKKPASHPWIVFIDVNYPPVAGSLEQQPWLGQAVSILSRTVKASGGRSPWNLVILTNHPYHYGSDSVPYPSEQAAIHIPDNPINAVERHEALDDLIKAVSQFGKIPSEFPAER